MDEFTKSSILQDLQDLTKEEYDTYMKQIENCENEYDLVFFLPFFKHLEIEEEEQIEFASSKPYVEAGVFKCFKCGSESVFAFSKQVRSADEGMSVFCKCSKCKHRWSHRG